MVIRRLGFVVIIAASMTACSRRASLSTLQGRGESVKSVALRVCADPNNLPFSNNKLDGFENKLADLVARELHRSVEYTWWAQRRGYVRNTIANGSCDVLMGVPTRFERTLVTRPYYRSTYVFVTRRDGPRVRSLDDDVLRHVRVGVQLIGDDGKNTPPAHALAARNIVRNVVGYSVYGDYLQPNPPARIIDAVARGDIDVAVAWGPLAGFFAAREGVPLALVPVEPAIDRFAALAELASRQPQGERVEGLPFTFAISVGVARRAAALRDEIDQVLLRRRASIDRLLDDYHVPRADRGE